MVAADTDILSIDEFIDSMGEPDLVDKTGAASIDEFVESMAPGKTPAPIPEIKSWGEYYSGKLKSGAVGVTRGQMGFEAIRGLRQYEDVRQDASIDSLTQLQQAGQSFESRVDPWGWPLIWAGKAAESLPFMGEVTLGGVKGAAGGAAVGAAGAAVAGQLGPQVGLPEEAVTVPAAAAFGARWGWRAGSFQTSSKLMAGQLYLDLRDQGITDTTAKPVALAGGAIMGIIETAQLGQLGSVGRREFVEQLRTEVGQAALKRYVSEYVKDVGVQVAEEELQLLTELASLTVSGIVEQNPDAIPTWEEVGQGVLDTAIESAQAAAVLVGGTKAAGGIAGKATSTTIDTLGKKAKGQEALQQGENVDTGVQVVKSVLGKLADGKATLDQVVTAFREGVEKSSRATPEAIQAAKNMDINETLDAILNPIDNVLQAGIQKTQEVELDATQGGPTLEQIAAAEGGDIVSAIDRIVEPNIAEALGGAPTLEVRGRINLVQDQLSDVDTEIAELEDEFTVRDDANTRAGELQGQIDYLKNQQKANAAQIRQLNNDIQQKRKADQPIDDISKTLDKIGTRQEAVYDQLTRAETELKALKKAPTTAILQKLDRLYNKRAALDEEKVLLENGLYEADDLKGLDIRVKADKVLALRAKAAKDVLKNFRKGVREGVKYTKQDVRAVQTQLVSLIKGSGMNPNDQAKFIRRLKSIQTPTQLQKAMPRIREQIDKLIEKDSRRQAMTRLGRLAKRAALRKGGGRPVGKYTAPIQKILDKYIEFVKNPEALLEAVEKGFDQMEQDAMTGIELSDMKSFSAADRMAFTVAQRVGYVPELSAAQLDKLADEIEAIIETGKAQAVEKKLAEQEERAERIEAALESINGQKPLDSADIWNSKARIKTWANNELTRLRDTLGRTTSSWDGLMSIISQHDQNNKMRELADVWPAVRQEYTNQTNSMNKMIDTVVAAVGQNKRVVLDRMVSGSIVESIGQYTDSDNVVRTLNLSRNQAIKLYMQFQDTDLEAGLHEGNRFTRPEHVEPTQTSTLDLLEQYLSDDDKAMAAGLMQFYREYYDRVNPEWEDEAGAPLVKNETYSGYAQREGMNEESAVAFLRETMTRASVKPASTISRVANSKALAPADAFIDALNHIMDFETWISWRKTHKQVRGIFANREVRNTIKLKYGDAMMRTIDGHYMDMIGARPRRQTDALKFFDKIRTTAGTAFVGGKAIQGLKQFTAITNFLLHVDGPGFVRGVVDFLANPVHAIRTMEKSPMLKARTQTFDKDLMDALRRDDIKAFKKRPTLLELTMFFVKYGDRVTIWTGGWAVYKDVLDKTGDPDKAMTAFEKAFNSTQSSGTIDQRSELEREGPAGKMVTLFLKQPMQMIEAEANAVRKALAIPTTENTMNAVRTIAIVHTSQFLFQAVASAPGILMGDAEEREGSLIALLRAAILGPMNGVPLYGDLLSAASTKITNWVFDQKERAWRPKFLPYEALGRAADLLQSAYKFVAEDASAETFFDVLEDYVRSVDLIMPKSLGGGVPKEPFLDMLSPVFVGEDENDDIFN